MLQLYPMVDPEEVAAAVVEELKEDEWNLNELERLQQEQVHMHGEQRVVHSRTQHVAGHGHT